MVASATLGGLEGNGNIALGTSSSAPISLAVGNNGDSTAFSGSIGYILGANHYNYGGLVKVGSGTLAISGYDYYINGTTVMGGTLEVVHSYSLGGGMVVVSRNGRLRLG
jgi:autotransporter-associated beta strand protein